MNVSLVDPALAVAAGASTAVAACACAKPVTVCGAVTTLDASDGDAQTGVSAGGSAAAVVAFVASEGS